jgi:hypothetical protein
MELHDYLIETDDGVRLGTVRAHSPREAVDLANRDSLILAAWAREGGHRGAFRACVTAYEVR